MANRTFATTTETPQAMPAVASPELESTKPTLTPGLGRGITQDAVTLRRMTNGRLPRAGKALRQLQQRYGNGYVQRLVVQAKMVLGSAHDPYEREADRAAAQTAQHTNNQKLKVQQQVHGGEGTTIMPDVESAINQARMGGQSLPKDVQQDMAQAFNADFSSVRVHTDPQSDQLNQILQARAFTTGTDIFFRRGEYKPDSQSGQYLLAHELTHVVQQQSVITGNQMVSRMGGTIATRLLYDAAKKNDRFMWLRGKKNFDMFIAWLAETKHKPLDDIPDSGKSEFLQYAAEYLEYLDAREREEKLKAEEMRGSEKLEAEIEAEVVTRLFEEKGEEVAIDLMRTRLGQMKDHQRKAFMARLPKKYHGLAFASAMGESEGDYALSWIAPLSLEQSEAVKPKLKKTGYSTKIKQQIRVNEFARWLYGDGPEPKYANCWEAVFMAGYRVGKLSKNAIKQIIGYQLESRTRGPQGLIDYITTNGQNHRSEAVKEDSLGFKSTKEEFDRAFVAFETSHPGTFDKLNEARAKLKKYNISDVEIEGIAKQLNAGDLIMFGDEGQHFGISLGGDRIMECDGSGAPTNVRIATIKDTVNRNEQYSRSIWWCPPEKLFSSLKAKTKKPKKKSKTEKSTSSSPKTTSSD